MVSASVPKTPLPARLLENMNVCIEWTAEGVRLMDGISLKDYQLLMPYCAAVEVQKIRSAFLKEMGRFGFNLDKETQIFRHPQFDLNCDPASIKAVKKTATRLPSTYADADKVPVAVPDAVVVAESAPIAADRAPSPAVADDTPSPIASDVMVESSPAASAAIAAVMAVPTPEPDGIMRDTEVCPMAASELPPAPVGAVSAAMEVDFGLMCDAEADVTTASDLELPPAAQWFITTIGLLTMTSFIPVEGGDLFVDDADAAITKEPLHLVKNKIRGKEYIYCFEAAREISAVFEDFMSANDLTHPSFPVMVYLHMRFRREYASFSNEVGGIAMLR